MTKISVVGRIIVLWTICSNNVIFVFTPFGQDKFNLDKAEVVLIKLILINFVAKIYLLEIHFKISR